MTFELQNVLYEFRYALKLLWIGTPTNNDIFIIWYNEDATAQWRVKSAHYGSFNTWCCSCIICTYYTLCAGYYTYMWSYTWRNWFLCNNKYYDMRYTHYMCKSINQQLYPCRFPFKPLIFIHIANIYDHYLGAKNECMNMQCLSLHALTHVIP